MSGRSCQVLWFHFSFSVRVKVDVNDGIQQLSRRKPRVALAYYCLTRYIAFVIAASSTQSLADYFCRTSSSSSMDNETEQNIDPKQLGHSSDETATNMAMTEITPRFPYHKHDSSNPYNDYSFENEHESEHFSPAYSTGTRTPRSRSSSAGSTLHWLSSLFARNPKALNEKRDYLLPKSKSSSRSSSPSLESQASTLLGSERETKKEKKIDARVISDAIIGLSDGLTVPFALTAGLSTMGSTRVVIFAGLAELTAGAISMGLGGYLAAKSEE